MEGFLKIYQADAIAEKWRTMYVITSEVDSKLTLTAKTDKNSRLPICVIDISFGVAVAVGGHRLNVYSKEHHQKQHAAQKDAFAKPFWKVQVPGANASATVKTINDSIASWKRENPLLVQEEMGNQGKKKPATPAVSTAHTHAHPSNQRTFSVLTLTGSYNVDTHEDISKNLPTKVGDASQGLAAATPTTGHLTVAMLPQHVKSKSSIQLHFLYTDTEPFKFDDETCQATLKGMVLNGSPVFLYVTRTGTRWLRMPLYKDMPLDDFYHSWTVDQSAEDVNSAFQSSETERYNIFLEVMNEIKSSVFPVIAVLRFLKSATEKPAVFGTLLIKWMTGQPLTSTLSRQLMLTQRSLWDIGLLTTPCTELTLIPSDSLQPYASIHNIIFNSPKRAITHYKSSSGSAIDYAETVLAEEIKNSSTSLAVKPHASPVAAVPTKKGGSKPELFVPGAPAVLTPAAQQTLNQYLQLLQLDPSGLGASISPPSVSVNAVAHGLPHPITSPLSAIPHRPSESGAIGSVDFFFKSTTDVLNKKQFDLNIDRKLSEGYGFCFTLSTVDATSNKKDSDDCPKHLFKYAQRGEGLSSFSVEQRMTLVKVVENWRASFRVINETIHHLQELDHDNTHTDRELIDVQSEHFANNITTLMSMEKTRWDRFFNPLVLASAFDARPVVLFRMFRQPTDTLAPLTFGDVLVNFGPAFSEAELSLLHWRDSSMTSKISTVVQASSVLEDRSKIDTLLDYSNVYLSLFKAKPTVTYGLRNDWTRETDDQDRTSSLFTKHLTDSIKASANGIGTVVHKGSVDMGKRLRFLTHRTNQIKTNLTKVFFKKNNGTHHHHHSSNRQKEHVDTTTPSATVVSLPTPLASEIKDKVAVEEEASEEEEEEEEEEKSGDEDEDDGASGLQMSEEEAQDLGFDSVAEVKTMIIQVELAYDKAKAAMEQAGKSIQNRNLLDFNYRKVMEKDVLINLKPDELRQRLKTLYQNGVLRKIVKLFQPDG